MPAIVPSPAPPPSRTPANSSRPTPAACAPWCTDTTGHAHTARPDALQTAEQSCRSTVHRIDSPLGGGHGTNRTAVSTAGLYLQAEQRPGEPPAYVLGVELGGTEHWARLRSADLRTLVTAARTLLAQTAA